MLQKTVDIVGVPSDLGANIRGANMGPAALRIAGLVDKIKAISSQVVDHGDIAVPVRDALSEKIKSAKFLEPITDICTDSVKKFTNLQKRVTCPSDDRGRSFSVAMGSISGVAKYYKEKTKTSVSFGLMLTVILILQILLKVVIFTVCH